MIKIVRIPLLFIYFILFYTSVYGIEKDTTTLYLDGIVVEGELNKSSLKISENGALVLDLDILNRLPKILGNADPLRYSQFLPGVQTNAEYDAGLHIYGCDNSHNIISVENVPVYNPSHMFGLFSVFNPAHYSAMSLNTNADAATGTNRIGGMLNMTLHDTIPHKTVGSFDVGAISSQGNLQIPISDKSFISFSLRASYLNLLYSSFLEWEDARMRYSFGDVNITYLYKFSKHNSIYIDFYSGNDKISNYDAKEDITTEVKWGNTLAAIHWKYDGAARVNQSIYYTGYKNRLYIGDNSLGVRLPSQIYDFGYNLEAKCRNMQMGLSFVNHHIEPQRPEHESSSLVIGADLKKYNTFEGLLYAKYSGDIFNNLRYVMAAKGVMYANESTNYTHWSVNPSARLSYEKEAWGCFEIGYTLNRQYLLNTGFTSLGLPIEFWLSCDADKKPYLSHAFHFSYSKSLFDNRYSIGVNIYFKRLFNQIEYNATPLDFFNKEYSINSVLLQGDGKNYGVNLIAKKNTGTFVGWVSYAYGRALRRFPSFGDSYVPANHERLHELNAVLTYRLNKKWDLGTTFVFASGCPFTAPKHFYLLNGNIVSEFGAHNANRTKPYSRLDVSANYEIVNRRGKNMGLNFSIYNLLLSENEIYKRLKFYDGEFYYSGFSFLVKILPSVSFYYKF